LLKDRSVEHGGSTEWIGCIDHILQLTTKIAFKDTPTSQGTMKACCNLVAFFYSSTQAMDKLLGKQVVGRAVKPIQNVSTHWWSTYSMLEHLLRLKLYLQVMAGEGEQWCHLTDEQWVIINDMCKLLQPFMVVPKLLEGQTYCTAGFVPYFIYKIWQGLIAARDDPTSSNHIVTTSTQMIDDLNARFGSGLPGTVATEYLTEGPRRRPKGLSFCFCFFFVM